MYYAKLKRLSPTPELESKRYKRSEMFREILTTSSTGDAQFLRHVLCEKCEKKEPPKFNNENCVDSQEDRLMNEIKLCASKIKVLGKENQLEESKIKELALRNNEKRALLSESKVNHEKFIENFKKAKDEIQENIKITEAEIEQNASNLNVISCKIESGQNYVNKLNLEAQEYLNYISRLRELQNIALAQKSQKEQEIQLKKQRILQLKDQISLIMPQCIDMHKIYLADQDSILKIKEEIKKISRN